MKLIMSTLITVDFMIGGGVSISPARNALPLDRAVRAENPDKAKASC